MRRSLAVIPAVLAVLVTGCGIGGPATPEVSPSGGHELTEAWSAEHGGFEVTAVQAVGATAVRPGLLAFCGKTSAGAAVRVLDLRDPRRPRSIRMDRPRGRGWTEPVSVAAVGGTLYAAWLNSGNGGGITRYDPPDPRPVWLHRSGEAVDKLVASTDPAGGGIVTREGGDAHVAIVNPATGRPIGGWYGVKPVAARAGRLYLNSSASTGTRTYHTTVVDARSGTPAERVGATLQAVTNRGDLVFDSVDHLIAYHAA